MASHNQTIVAVISLAQPRVEVPTALGPKRPAVGSAVIVDVVKAQELKRPLATACARELRAQRAAQELMARSGARW